MKLNGTHQLLVYTDVNVLGGSICTIKENTDALLVSSKVIGLEVNSDKTKYTVMSLNRNAEQSHDIQIAKSSFERVEEFKYFRKAITNQNSSQEEIKRLKSGNAYYHSVQNLLSSSSLSKNIKITIYRTIIFPAVLYGCETWSLTMREEHRLFAFENRVLRIFGPKRYKRGMEKTK